MRNDPLSPLVIYSEINQSYDTEADAIEVLRERKAPAFAQARYRVTFANKWHRPRVNCILYEKYPPQITVYISVIRKKGTL